MSEEEILNLVAAIIDGERAGSEGELIVRFAEEARKMGFPDEEVRGAAETLACAISGEKKMSFDAQFALEAFYLPLLK